MKFYLDARKGKDGKHAVVIRGREKSGKPYRIFLSTVFSTARLEKSNWKQKQREVIDNPIIAETLKGIKTKLEIRN